MKRIDVTETACELLAADNIQIFTHRNPDGDTLGSGFALMYALISLGKRAKVVCCDKIPQKYGYMLGNRREDFKADYNVAVDVADIKLLGDKFSAEYKDKIDLCIDHHGSNTGYARLLLLDNRAAASEIIFEVISALKAEITPLIASCIYTGIATDTGCFLFSNVTPETHIIAAEMIKKGADYININRVMFETKSLGYLKLEKAALNTIDILFGGKCAVMSITQKMLSDTGTDESDCDGIAGIPRKIDGVLVGVTVRERSDGSYKVSLRSHEPVDSAKICAAMGGGGHARAAGCELSRENMNEEKAKLLSVIEAELKNI